MANKVPETLLMIGWKHLLLR